MRAAIFCWVMLVLGLPLARALTPEQVAIVFNQNNADSQLVATAYMKARGIPKGNLIGLNIIGHDETTTPAAYEADVENIRDTLRARHLDGVVTCLVTVYGVPLKIAAETPTANDAAGLRALREQLVAACVQVKAGIGELDALAPLGLALPTTAPASGAAPEVPPPGVLLPQAQAAVRRTLDRLNAISGADRAAALQAFLPLEQKLFGVSGTVALLHVNPDAPAASAASTVLSDARTKLAADDAAYAKLSSKREDAAARAEMLRLRGEMGGAVGTVLELETDLAALQHEQTQSCFDNELMMLWIDGYPRTRWLMNPYSLEACAGRGGLPVDRPHEMMVARLDGVSREEVLGMIRTTLETEAKGLRGIAYFDARGNHGTDAYGQFDANLRDAAEWVRENSSMRVVLDDKPALLQAKDCPDAALYCGWYSYFHYVDSCQWLPGSVGYHVASGEMGSLHDPNTPAWVPNLLKRGMVATLGPVNEPYLFAFPKPREFFPLLMSGQWTLGEVYFMTIPNTSWQIGLVGDPLYRPFGKHPAVAAEKIKEDALLRWAYTIEPVGGKS